MHKTTFSIPKMDCTAEERLVRTALSGTDEVVNLIFDLSKRELAVVHRGDGDAIGVALASLNLGAQRIESTPASELDAIPAPAAADEARVLKQVLVINASMFFVEIVGAWIAQSSALMADSLDMFADAAVYGLALYGVHRARATQLKAAHLAGGLQLLLGLAALGEVVRRILFGSEPRALLIVVVAAVALAANVTSMWLLSRHRSGGAHMQASWIFTTSDVLANLGVIVAAALVRLTGSNVPDLVVATVIAFVVLNAAFRILRLR